MKSAVAAMASRLASARSGWSGDNTQTGSVRPASPVSAKAWQRQPPQSISRRSQERHGSGIQSVPRNRANAREPYQISARLAASLTLGKSKSGKGSAAGHGK